MRIDRHESSSFRTLRVLFIMTLSRSEERTASRVSLPFTLHTRVLDDAVEEMLHHHQTKVVSLSSSSSPPDARVGQVVPERSSQALRGHVHRRIYELGTGVCSNGAREDNGGTRVAQAVRVVQRSSTAGGTGHDAVHHVDGARVFSRRKSNIGELAIARARRNAASACESKQTNSPHPRLRTQK